MHRGYPAVERRGHGKDFGHAMWSVGSRELRQPRTEADGEAGHGEQPGSARPRKRAADMVGDLVVAVEADAAPERVNLCAMSWCAPGRQLSGLDRDGILGSVTGCATRLMLTKWVYVTLSVVEVRP